MTRHLFLAASLLAATTALYAQDGPPPSGPGMQGPPPAQSHGKQRGPDGGRPDGRPEAREGDMRGPVGHLLPPGTWWRNPETVTALGLSPDQTKRIDDLFLQSRVKLVDLHASLEKEQLMLEPLLNANPVDQGKAMAEISKIADTRAELEKTDARMLLGIRAVLTADQWTKLQGEHGGRHRGDGQRGPGGQGGKMRGGNPPPPQAE